MPKSFKKYDVYDTGNSCIIKEYKRLSSAKKKRNKELMERNLPENFIIIRDTDTLQRKV